jgi:hypothetical protein
LVIELHLQTGSLIRYFLFEFLVQDLPLASLRICK